MTVLPDLADQLVRAAERRGAPVRRRRRRVHFGLPLLGVVVVSGTALAATGTWRPELGDERRDRPTASATAAPVTQTKILGVLRRPVTAADRGQRSKYALRFLDRGFVDGVRTDAVRLLSTADRGYILVPAQHGPGRSGPTDGVAADGDEVVCLFAVDVEGGGISCYTAQQILDGNARLMFSRLADPTPAQQAAFKKAVKAAHGKSFTSPFPPRQEGPTTLAGLVPDGITRVQIDASSGVATAPASSNFFRLIIPLNDNGSPPQLGALRWYDRDNREVANFPPHR